MGPDPAGGRQPNTGIPTYCLANFPRKVPEIKKGVRKGPP